MSKTKLPSGGGSYVLKENGDLELTRKPTAAAAKPAKPARPQTRKTNASKEA